MINPQQSGRVLDDAAVLDFPLSGVHLIEASAGTGKTYSIANLYLRQILAGREVGEVLVVTFTKAATDELRGRLRARLFDALALLEQGGDGKDAFLTCSPSASAPRARRSRPCAGCGSRCAPWTRRRCSASTASATAPCSEFAFNSGQGFGLESSPTTRAGGRPAGLVAAPAYPLDAPKGWPRSARAGVPMANGSRRSCATPRP
jgi:exodeoxyribonuclease V beta subunit